MDLAYIDYDFYIDVYMGTVIPEDLFQRMATVAASYMNFVTLDRLINLAPDEITTRIMMCNAELAEFEYLQKLAFDSYIEDNGRLVTSERVANHSKNYGNRNGTGSRVNMSTSSDIDIANLERDSICKKWLTSPINLMYIRAPIYDH